VGGLVIYSALGAGMTNEMRPLDRFGSFSGLSFSGLVEAVPDALLVIDADGQITFGNAYSEQLFGYSRSQLLGNPGPLCQ